MTGSLLSADHLVVGDVRAQSVDGESGVGVLVFDDADLQISHFTVENSALVGLQVARYGYVTGADGVIRKNPIGVNLQQTTFDPGENFVRVRLEDNEINVDTSAIAVPSLTGL